MDLLDQLPVNHLKFLSVWFAVLFDNGLLGGPDSDIIVGEFRPKEIRNLTGVKVLFKNNTIV